MSENVRTYLRIKPQTIPEDLTITGDTIRIDKAEFSFDKIFRNSTQQEVFQELSDKLLVECMQGYNCTLFAYGQTGSGKTYTIQGNSHSMGLVQRTLGFLHKNTELRISLSFVEIYNETMLDLFEPTAILSIREDPFAGVVVDNLNVLESGSYEESMELYSRGTRTRRTASTSMNKESSRSHSVFTIHLEDSGGAVSKSSRLCFVDLAGSERLREREIEEVKLKETGNINKSLLCLGKIINKLSSEDDCHISYRESKLTFLLKESLGGNCKLTVIGNVSLEYRNDSLNTINFLIRSKMVRNLAVANSSVSGELDDVKDKLKALDKENQRLRTRLALVNGDFQENSSVSPLYCHDVRQIMGLLSEVMDKFQDLEEIARKLMNSGFDRNRTLLLNIHDHFVSFCQERKENIETVIKRKRRKEGNEGSISFE